MSDELDILVGDVPAGILRFDNERSEFSTLGSYRDLYPRPVLGQQFEDDLTRIHASTVRLPPYFANLLPEGPLRQLIARQASVHEMREFYLLGYLGKDLIGAVRALPRSPLQDVESSASSKTQDKGTSLRFSLAGVQLKFSMLRDRDRLTLPAGDRYGDWIVKLPDRRFERVPENEFSMLEWCEAAGLETPEHKLIDTALLHGLPADVIPAPGRALAIKRFDRPTPGVRIHQEDFAQVFGLYPEQKYAHYNYESIGKVILHTAGPAEFDKYVKRLLFVILSGNADAHHKNWSLQYPGPFSVKLTPVYDQVATLLYPEVDRQMALNLARSKDFGSVRMRSFTRMAEKLKLDSAHLQRVVRHSVECILDAWSQFVTTSLLTRSERDTIEEHWRRIPLLQRITTSVPR